MSSPHELGTICVNVILRDLFFLSSIRAGTKPNFVDRSLSEPGFLSLGFLKRAYHQESRKTCVHEVSQMVDQFWEFVKLTKSVNELAHILQLLPKAIEGIQNLAITYEDTTSVKTTLSTLALKMAKLIKTTSHRIVRLETARKKRRDSRKKRTESLPPADADFALAKTSTRLASPSTAQYPAPRPSPVLVPVPSLKSSTESRPGVSTPASWLAQRELNKSLKPS